jgi:hypothetical protein
MRATVELSKIPDKPSRPHIPGVPWPWPGPRGPYGSLVLEPAVSVFGICFPPPCATPVVICAAACPERQTQARHKRQIIRNATTFAPAARGMKCLIFSSILVSSLRRRYKAALRDGAPEWCGMQRHSHCTKQRTAIRDSDDSPSRTKLL